MVTSYGQLQEWFPDEETTFYFIHITIVKITDADFKSFDGIKIQYDFIMLEGKVLVEEFNTDPVLIITYSDIATLVIHLKVQ